MSSEATDKNICDLPTDGTCVTLDVFINKTTDCIIPQGSCFGLQERIVDKHGHEIDGDWKQDKNGEWVLRDKDECDHKDSPEYKAEHKKVIKKVAKQEIIQTDTVTDITTYTDTVAIVEVPKVEVKPPEKQPSFEAALPVVMGIVGGVAGPMLTNLIKNFIKNKFKKPGQEQKEEEKQEEPTDCKTHQIKSNAKFLSFSKRLGLLEQKAETTKEGKSSDLDVDMDQVQDLAERIEKLEKALKKK